MKLENEIKNKMNEDLPYIPAYEEFAKLANIEPKKRKRRPVYHSFKSLIGGALISATALGALGAIIPAVISQNNSVETISFLKYRPAKLSRKTSLTDETAKIYEDFVEIVTKQFFVLNQEEEVSQCISLPDLFFCYSMLVTASDASAQEVFLNAIGAESIDQLKAAANELASYLVFLDKADEAGESDSGAVNLNGFFYDSSAKLKDGYDAYLQDFSNYFNSYSFSSKPTNELVDKWVESEDPDNYLSESISPLFKEDDAITTISSYVLVDSFSEKQKLAYKEAYINGTSNIDFYKENDEVLVSDVLEFDYEGRSVTVGPDFQKTSVTINQTEVEVYLPSGEVDSFATTIFDEKEVREVTHQELKVYLPMFNIKTTLNETAEKLFPDLAGKTLGTSFIDSASGNELNSSLSQYNDLTLDYNGFKGSSIKSNKFSGTVIFENAIEFYVDKPFVFSVSYKGIDLYYGKVHDPSYPSYSEDTIVSEDSSYSE